MVETFIEKYFNILAVGMRVIPLQMQRRDAQSSEKHELKDIQVQRLEINKLLVSSLKQWE